MKAIKIFCDGADLSAMEKLEPVVDGFTTNPSLMKKAGIKDYRDFARAVIERANGKPISFEVLADSRTQCIKQAQEIASWAENIWVKIPIMFTNGETTLAMIADLTALDIKVNITAIMTADQIRMAARAVECDDCILSVFAGRIADTGRDPCGIIEHGTLTRMKQYSMLWASAREVYNVKQAIQCGCDIITLTPELIAKMSMFGKDLTAYSRETVQMFHNDSKGIKL